MAPLSQLASQLLAQFSGVWWSEVAQGQRFSGRLTSSAAVVFLQRRWQFGRSEKRTDLQKLATSGLNLDGLCLVGGCSKPPPQKKGSLNEVRSGGNKKKQKL